MNKIYKINLEDVIWGSVNKKTLLIKIPGTVFELKGVGLDIWKMLLKNYSTHRILKNLIKKYKLHKKQIKIDLEIFIEQLKNKNIINEIH